MVHITAVPMTIRAFLLDQLNYFAQNGYIIHIICSQGPELKNLSKQFPDLIVHPIRINRPISPIIDLFSLLRIIIELFSIKPTIVHTHTPKASLLGILAAYICHVPIRIFHVHGFVKSSSKGMMFHLLKFFDWITIKLSTYVIAVSKSSRDYINVQYLTTGKKAITIANGSINGVDARHRFNPARFSEEFKALFKQELGIPTSNVIVGFIGRIVRDKGISVLYDAWQLVKSKVNNVTLIIIGPMDLKNGLRTKLQSNNSIIICDHDWEIERYYSIMDIFVLPSYREGFPVTLLEASAMELPIITTDIPGCNEAVKNNLNGILIKPCDHQHLADSIEQLIIDKKLAWSMGIAGRKRVESDFQPINIWKETLDIYRTQAANV